MPKSKNKVALITGASRGIGAATALLLAKNGYNIAINYLINKDAAQRIATQAKKYKTEAIIIKADLSKEAQIIEMFNKIDQEYGRLDALVNNGAIKSEAKTIDEISFSHLEKIYKTNVFSVFLCCREAIKRMKQGNGGSIVNVSSLTAKLGGFKMTDYASSKAAVENLTIGLSKEVAEFNIRVNAVSPGAINTEDQKEISSQRKKHFMETIPMKRMGRPEEVAESIFWLLSDLSSYITGSTLSINGGK